MTMQLIGFFPQSKELDVSYLLQDPIVVATSCSYRRLLTRSNVPVCTPCTQRSDNHPDLDADMAVLQLMAASPELYESTKMLLKTVQDLLANKSIRNLDETLLFAQHALDKAYGKD